MVGSLCAIEFGGQGHMISFPHLIHVFFNTWKGTCVSPETISLTYPNTEISIHANNLVPKTDPHGKVSPSFHHNILGDHSDLVPTNADQVINLGLHSISIRLIHVIECSSMFQSFSSDLANNNGFIASLTKKYF